jgi:hypothetical protein
MAGLIKKQRHMSDELSELLYNREPSDILEGEFSDNSDMNVDVSSGNEQRANFDDDDNANDNRDMQYDTWTRVGIERPCLHFSGKSGTNVDLED